MGPSRALLRWSIEGARFVNGFDVAGIQLYQTLGVRNHDDGDMSATRSDWK
jgi:hypothetical protein